MRTKRSNKWFQVSIPTNDFLRKLPVIERTPANFTASKKREVEPNEAALLPFFDRANYFADCLAFPDRLDVLIEPGLGILKEQLVGHRQRLHGLAKGRFNRSLGLEIVARRFSADRIGGLLPFF